MSDTPIADIYKMTAEELAADPTHLDLLIADLRQKRINFNTAATPAKSSTKIAQPKLDLKITL